MIELTNNKEQQETRTKLVEHEHSKTEFLVYPLRVIISPFKAFREIIQNPDFRGILLIAGLVLLATAGLYYSYAAKVFISINGIQTSFVASDLFPSFLIQTLTLNTLLLFAFNWLIYAGILFLVMRIFGQKGGTWRPFFVLVGYAFSIMIIQVAVSALLFAALPEVHFNNLSVWPPSTEAEATIANAGIQENWAPSLVYQAITYLNFPIINVIDVWLAMLTVVIVHSYSEMTWGKAAMIAILALAIRVFLRLFIGL